MIWMKCLTYIRAILDTLFLPHENPIKYILLLIALFRDVETKMLRRYTAIKW